MTKVDMQELFIGSGTDPISLLTLLSLPSPKEVMFSLRSVCLSVCLSVHRITEKVVNGFWRNFLEVGRGPGTKGINFGDDPDHHPDPGVRSPKSGFTALSKSYQRILMKFYGELGCGLETNWLHFGDDPHHYPDRGVRSRSRSGSGKNWHSAEVGAVWVLLVVFVFFCRDDPL